VNVYTGKITDVGDHHIEYNINYCSCVFALQGSTCDYGKAITVHAGAHPTLLMNQKQLGL
jgi:hypothetical protein